MSLTNEQRAALEDVIESATSIEGDVHGPVVARDYGRIEAHVESLISEAVEAARAEEREAAARIMCSSCHHFVGVVRHEREGWWHVNGKRCDADTIRARTKGAEPPCSTPSAPSASTDHASGRASGAPGTPPSSPVSALSTEGPTPSAGSPTPSTTASTPTTATRPSPLGGGRGSAWIACPICGESDMHVEPDGDEGGKIVHCVNLECASNGGDNARALLARLAPAPISTRGAEGGLSFASLRLANEARHAEWWTGTPPSLSFRGNELAGGVGEACNVIKKLDREAMGLRGSRSTKEALADELADVIICTDLIAMDQGVDVDAAVTRKFNATSAKLGLRTRIATADERAALAAPPSPDGGGDAAVLLAGHPRCAKLLREGRPFFVVANDEPYAKCVAALIKNVEDGMGKWTAEDEARACAMLHVDVIDKTPPNAHKRLRRAEAEVESLRALLDAVRAIEPWLRAVAASNAVGDPSELRLASKAIHGTSDVVSITLADARAILAALGDS